MDAYVLGIDGCHSGWLVCRYELSTLQMSFRVFRNLGDVLNCHESAEFIAVDIPIGLRDDGQPRSCDAEARRLLTPRRSSCVFPAPPRRMLDAPNYREACKQSLRWFGRKISQQSYAIYRKTSEVDKLMDPKTQERVFEVHPEVCFWRINGGRALLTSKKSRKGYEERRNLLNAACGIKLPDSWKWLSILPHCPAGASRDDLVDAAVAAHVGRNKFMGTAKTLPEFPEIDDKGIRMEMVF
jgi:predicted RNase H-like nuclease